MLSFAVRSTSALTPALSATNQVVASTLRPLIPAFVQKGQNIFVQTPPEGKTSDALFALLPQGGCLNVRANSAVVSNFNQVRFAHTDVPFPDFSYYRRDGTKAVKGPSPNSEARKAFTYMMLAASCVPATYGAKAMVVEFVSSMSASADVLALAKIEVNLADIPEGKNVTFKWRNKPLFIRHRPADEIAREEAVSLSDLRDQETDAQRVQKAEWLIVLGICTHLGCVPIANAGEYGGYYCPCHGSHYDASGRIRKGPAPTNLEIPPYTFTTETTVTVG
ncbi:Cytochrome b-c1 complex subunit Rieske, mitochondrial [Lamellibrachia satsuma]|nr:Cytochrome b-c1 complex subunit Rieske, mitochondrial [Lamellibrachia satsuma]